MGVGKSGQRCDTAAFSFLPVDCLAFLPSFGLLHLRNIFYNELTNFKEGLFSSLPSLTTL